MASNLFLVLFFLGVPFPPITIGVRSGHPLYLFTYGSATLTNRKKDAAPTPHAQLARPSLFLTTVIVKTQLLEIIYN